LGAEMNDVIKEFDELCDIAIAAFGEELDITYERSLINILEFVKNILAVKNIS